MPNINQFTLEFTSHDSNVATVEVDIAIFTSGQKSKLLCKHCTQDKGTPTFWCEHLAQVISSGADQVVLWGPEPGVSPLPDEDFQVEVPVFPTRDQWAVVRFQGGDVPIGKRYSASLKFIHPVQYNFICFVSPGEGLQAVRTTLIEYMRAHSDPSLECRAGHHGTVAETVWREKKASTNPNAILPDLWSLFITGWCLYCDENNPANDPGLVPVGDGSGGFPR